MQTRAAVAASRDEAQAALDQAMANAAEATSNLARTEELFQRRVATEATLDAVRTAAAGAALAVTRAEATLEAVLGAWRWTTSPMSSWPRATSMRPRPNWPRAKLDLARARGGRTDQRHDP